MADAHAQYPSSHRPGSHPDWEPPPDEVGHLAHVRKAYFGSLGNTVVSLVCIALMVVTAQSFIEWALLNAHWTADPDACRLDRSGACWSFVGRKLRFMIFGFYPYELHWRPAAALMLFLAMCGATMLPRFWRRGLLIAWGAALAAAFWLMSGDGFVLERIPTSKWGGLPLTIMLSFIGLVAAFPFGIVLALARRSRLPAIRSLAIVYIECIRGVPLISLLFMATVMLPLFLPEGYSIDKVLRAQVAIILFAAAYIAEVVRGGLQGIDSGQYEAGSSLGLTYWQSMRLVILPQALKIVIPPMVTTFIGFFQDTTLVTIVGLFDFLNTVRGSMRDPVWQGIAVAEAYLFAAAVYFVFSYGMARYSRYLERRFARDHD